MPARRGLATKGWVVPATIVHVRKVDCDTWDERIEQQQMAVPVETVSNTDTMSFWMWLISGGVALLSYLFKKELSTKISDKDTREIVRNAIDDYHEKIIMEERKAAETRHKENQNWLRRIERKVDWRKDDGEQED